MIILTPNKTKNVYSFPYLGFVKIEYVQLENVIELSDFLKSLCGSN